MYIWSVCADAVVFCFQAEDGIRDLVRSRGLGDVYKRQELAFHTDLKREDVITYYTTCGWMMWNWLVSSLYAVSYTHLTLPTSDLV